MSLTNWYRNPHEEEIKLTEFPDENAKAQRQRMHYKNPLESYTSKYDLLEMLNNGHLYGKLNGYVKKVYYPMVPSTEKSYVTNLCFISYQSSIELQTLFSKFYST